MATPRANIIAAYPLPAYNYRVTIESDTVAFSEVSGLSIDHEMVIYKDGLSFLMGYDIIRGQQKQVNIVMRRGVVKGDDFLFDWVDLSFVEKLLDRFSSQTRRDITIDLCDETGKAIVRWKVLKAIPVKLEAPTFNAENNSVAIESIELQAQGLTIEYL
jgi:phage tail-like protein